MPQINEYNSQVDAQGPVGGVTPNLEAVSLFGRSLEHVGAALGEASDVIHRRNAQEEVSTIYGQFAQARADWTSKLKNRLRDGTLDTNQFNQEYADYVNKIGDSVSTAEGKDFFNKQANRLGGTLMQSAIAGQVAIKGQQAYETLKTGVDTNSSSLMKDPDQFPDVHDSTLEMISHQQQTGAINETQASRLRLELMPKLAMGAAKGWADQDPGVGEDGKPNENRLKSILDKGGFDQYLNEGQKSSLYAYARQQDHFRAIDKATQDKQVTDVQDKVASQWVDGKMNALLSGNLTMDDIKNAPIGVDKWQMAQRLQQQASWETRSDPHSKVQLYKDIYEGNVTSAQQVFERASQEQLSNADVKSAISTINLTPEGHRLNEDRKRISKVAQSLINFKDPMGQNSPVGQAKFGMFLDEMMQGEKDAKANGEDFYDLKNPKLINMIQKYVPSAQDTMRLNSRTNLNQALGIPNPPPPGTVNSNLPSGQIPPDAPPPPNIPAVKGKDVPAAANPPPAAEAADSGSSLFGRMADQDKRSGGEATDLMNAVFGKPGSSDHRDQQRAEERRILGIKPAPAATSAPKQEALKKEVMQPGETPEQYLKRRGL